MNDDHHAIIVGIQTYPGMPPSLKGPENDAAAIFKWLTDKNGGGVPQKNVSVVTRKGLKAPLAAKAPGARPNQADVEDVFTGLLEMGSDKAATALGGMRLGKRLYIYVSGHGFSPGPGRAALVTANATPNNPVHSHTTAWAEDLAKARLFDEIVVWTDCCMRDSAGLTYAGGASRRPSSTGASPRFIACAAQYQQDAKETKIKKQVRGVFTVALLDALRDAVDPARGVVTAEQLHKVLKNSMKRYLKPKDLNDDTVSHAPYVLAEANMEFGPKQRAKGQPVARAKATAPVEIHFPAALRGKPAQIIDGKFKEIDRVKKAPGKWKLELPIGRYALLRVGSEPQAFDIVSTDRFSLVLQ